MPIRHGTGHGRRASRVRPHDRKKRPGLYVGVGAPVAARAHGVLRLVDGQTMDDLVVQALSELMPGGVRRGELLRDNRTLRWVEAGSGSPAVVFDAALGEPGALAWA